MDLCHSHITVACSDGLTPVRTGTIYLEKFGETRLEDAGDCFALAKCWDDAASAYARVNCISKCLDACLKGQFFKRGLELIERWKKSKCNTDCGKCHGCEILNLETEYLQKSATHYHRIKDTQSMMIFVKALPTLDLIRSFLLKKDYFDELVGVEAAAGNFNKAAEIAEMKGDLLLESEMLLKAGQYVRAIKSILFHVQLNSWWSKSNKGWPLEKFHGNIELLEKVKHIAGKEPKYVYDSINLEVEILSDELYSLPKLIEHKIAAQRIRKIRLEIFTLRKALDAHLHSDLKTFNLHEGMRLFGEDDYSKMLLHNRISPKTLVSLWGEWKGKLFYSLNSLSRLEKQQEAQLFSSLNSLSRLEKQQEAQLFSSLNSLSRLEQQQKEQDILYLEYALEYFGVRKSENDTFCTVFNSEAFWLKGGRVKMLKRRGNTAQISFQKFLVLAKYFFTMDLYYVGQHVIQKLDQLYDFCTRENSSLQQEYLLDKRFQVLETVKNIELPHIAKFDRALLLQIYQVIRSLKNMEHLTGPTGLRQETKFDVMLNDCKERFFYFFFPLKHGTINVKEFISLREDAAAILILQDISEDIVSNMQRPPTLGQIGILQVVLPLLPKDLVSQYLMKISTCLDDTHYWNDQMLWLHINTFPEISSQDKRMCLVKGFEKALCSTFNSWEKVVYISPHIFLTLLEKLFFLASSCRHLSTGLCLPRSFFIEFMTGKQGEFFQSWLLESKSQPGCEGSSENFYVPLRDIISKLLIDKHRTVKRWIETSNINCREYFPEFILRLISMLCLISVNSTGKLTDNAQLLQQIFGDSQSTENLPLKFRNSLLQLLEKRSSNQKAFLINLSQAMRIVNNPLVVIYFNDSHKRIDCKDVIILTQENLSCKKTVLQAVFQERDDLFSSNERKEDFENHDIWIQD